MKTAMGAVVALLVLVRLGGVALAEQIEFRAVLTGYHHDMPVETPARGEAVFWLSEDGSELRYRLTVSDVEDVTMSHLHLGEEYHICTPNCLAISFFATTQADPRQIRGYPG